MLVEATKNAARVGNKLPSSPVRVCLLGSEGAGKTCFLAGLAVFQEANRGTSIEVRAFDPVTARYLEDLRLTLRRQSWPPPTSMTSELTVQVTIDGHAIDLVVIDYPGEDFRQALRLLDMDRVEALYRHCARAEAILLLVDPQADLLRKDGEERPMLVDRQMALLSAISQAWTERQGGSSTATEPPLNLAVVLTKCDLTAAPKTSREAARFFRAGAASLDAKLRQRAEAIQYFTVSATGGTELIAPADGVPLPAPAQVLAPDGYERLFRWIIRRHRWQKRRYWLKRLGLPAAAVATAIMALSLGVVFYNNHRRSRAAAALTDDGLTPLERIERTKDIDDQQVNQDRAKLIQQQLDAIETDIAAAGDATELDDLLQRLERLSQADPGLSEGRIRDLKARVRERQEQLRFMRISAARDSTSANFHQMAQEYLGQHSSGTHAKQVKHWLEDDELQQAKLARAKIRQLAVVNAATLKSKSDRISEFLAEKPHGLSETEVEQMTRAAELARRFSEANRYKVTLKRSGGFLDARAQGIQVFIAGTLQNEFKHKDSSKSVTWPADTTLAVEWHCGQSIKVVLRDYFLRDEDVATLTSDGSLALRILGSRSNFTRFADGWKDACPNAFVDFVIDGVSDGDWQALEWYILPGDRW